jgi:cytochrome c-type biogenesis protein CcmE
LDWKGDTVTRKQRRLTLIATAGAVLAVAVGLVLFALNSKITFFATPSDIVANKVQPGQRLRLGGLVEAGSIKRDATTVAFRVTDTNQTINVTYTGIVPDLFREGQGVVAEGAIDASGLFKADSLLAKHDENYMPKEVADALKAQGHWVEGTSYGKKP